jgi:hypothetical protein
MKLYNLITLLFLFLSFACKRNEIDKTIVLKIGNFEVTKYELERNKNRELSNDGTDTAEIKNPKKIAIWEKNYIERCIVAAEAFRKSYDTIGDIQKKLRIVGDEMMVQKYGYLWDKLVKPQVDSIRELDKIKINKRKKLYYFDLIACYSLDSLLKVTNNDTVLKNKDDFSRLKKKIPHNKFFETHYVSIQWPFSYFWHYNDYLYKMKEGEVSKLLSLPTNYIFLYLDHIENVDLSEKENENLKMELQIGFLQESEEKEAREIQDQCQPSYNELNIDTIIDFINAGNSIFEFKKDLELVKFNLDHQRTSIYFKEFLENYSNMLMQTEIKDKASLAAGISDFCSQKYLVAKGRRLGLYDTDKFKLDRKNFLNNLLYSYYLQKDIYDRIKIDSSEILNYYHENINSFEKPRYITIDMFMFNNMADAFKNKRIISKQMQDNLHRKAVDTAVITDLCGYLPEVKFDLDNRKDGLDAFYKSLEYAQMNTLSYTPIQYNGKYVLIYKRKEEEKYTRKFRDVYKEVDGKLIGMKADEMISNLIKELNSKYKLEINKTGVEYQ